MNASAQTTIVNEAQSVPIQTEGINTGSKPPPANKFSLNSLLVDTPPVTAPSQKPTINVISDGLTTQSNDESSPSLNVRDSQLPKSSSPYSLTNILIDKPATAAPTIRRTVIRPPHQSVPQLPTVSSPRVFQQPAMPSQSILPSFNLASVHNEPSRNVQAMPFQFYSQFSNFQYPSYQSSYYQGTNPQQPVYQFYSALPQYPQMQASMMQLQPYQQQQHQRQYTTIPVPKIGQIARNENEEESIRCVCGDKSSNSSLLVFCDRCKHWLHGACINVPRTKPDEEYVCPYCRGITINCVCHENNRYDLPIIQCTQCHKWCHKACQGLDYGRVPENFICKECGEVEYEVLPVEFEPDDNTILNTKVAVECDHEEILRKIPDGMFRNQIIEDLDKTELDFREFVQRYFTQYVTVFFNRSHEFWRLFIDCACKMLKCERQDIFHAIDDLAGAIIYNSQSDNKVIPFNRFSHSAAISEYLSTLNPQHIEKPLRPPKLFVGEDNYLHTPAPIEDGGFVAFLPGFLMHMEEVQSDNGIPLSCLTLTDSDLVIDMEGSTFKFAPHIRRSFHFNAIVKLVKVGDQLRVAIFATRMKGPLCDEKSRRGPAIVEGGEIILPYDGDIPYPVPKIEWKDKKARPKQQIITPKPRSVSPPTFHEMHTRKSSKPKKTERQMLTRKKVEASPALTLLSCFDEAVPPAPFVLLPDRESVDKYINHQEMKSRIRNHLDLPSSSSFD